MSEAWAEKLAKELYITATVMPKYETVAAIADQLEKASHMSAAEHVYTAAAAFMIDFLNRHPEVRSADDFQCPYMRELYVALGFPRTRR